MRVPLHNGKQLRFIRIRGYFLPSLLDGGELDSDFFVLESDFLVGVLPFFSASAFFL